METALSIGLANAVIAALLAVLMGCSALIWRKPALTHALGVLVLLKLLTPPMWRVPMGQWFSLQSESGATETKIVLPPRAESKLLVDRPAWRDEEFAVIAPPSETSGDPVELPPILPNVADPPVAPVKVFEPPAPHDWFAAWLKESLPLMGAMAWITGSVMCGLVIAIRIIRFQRLLRLADLAPPELQSRAGALARRMGVIRAPAVHFVPGAVCPMLWAIGGSSRLLIPCELWDRLGERQRSSLLAHELAHLKRRDHWVRLIEVLASVVYWWCPVTWYARRKLREAEEQLCDAWVIWAIPGSGRDYASALLEAVEFVAAARVNAARSMPALASGMGQFHQLKRRLVMIKNERISKKLSLSGWAMVCGLAVLLPLSPTRAQVAPAADPASDKVTAAPDAVPGTGNLRPPAGESAVIDDLKTRPGPSTGGPLGAGPSTSAPGSTAYSKGSEVDKLNAERDALRAEVRELSKQLEITQRRLKELDAAAKGYKTWTGTPGGPGEPLPPTPAIPAPEGRINFGNKPAKPGTTPDLKEYPKAKPVDPNDPRSRDRRLAEVEANLRVLLDEVRALKNESKGDYAPPAKRNFDKDNDETVTPKGGGR